LEPSEGVTWLLQMAREMSIETQSWDLFAVTWKAMGFTFEESTLKRIRAHARQVGLFQNEVRDDLVPKGTRITALDLDAWIVRFGRLQKVHAQLIPAFRRESERFTAQFAEAGAVWSTVGDER
jgi:hypothetical protein